MQVRKRGSERKKTGQPRMPSGGAEETGESSGKEGRSRTVERDGTSELFSESSIASESKGEKYSKGEIDCLNEQGELETPVGQDSQNAETGSLKGRGLSKQGPRGRLPHSHRA